MSKPTHILIPIKDIEDNIEAFKQFFQYSDEGNTSLEENNIAQGCLNVYEKLLSTEKQISLNEDDINKAASAWEETNNLCYPLENEDYKRTYQQVIKDIFKL